MGHGQHSHPSRRAAEDHFSNLLVGQLLARCNLRGRRACARGLVPAKTAFITSVRSGWLCMANLVESFWPSCYNEAVICTQVRCEITASGEVICTRVLYLRCLYSANYGFIITRRRTVQITAS